MTIINCGTLNVCAAGEASVDYAWKVVVAAFAEEGIDDTDYGVSFDNGALRIDFNEYGDSNFGDTLSNVMKLLPKNVWLEGSLTYWGDYDGWIDVTRDGVESGDKSSEDLHYATDKELIGILKKRGYMVTKTKKAKKGDKK